jgi:hypothetical protein
VRPRYTKDLDIFVEPSIKNGERIVGALQEFGFGSLKVTAEDFVQPGRFIQLGYEPVRVDLLTSLEGFTFEQVWQHRALGRYGNARVPFIGRQELIRNKALVGRPQDQADLERLRPRRVRGIKKKRSGG